MGKGHAYPQTCLYPSYTNVPLPNSGYCATGENENLNLAGIRLDGVSSFNSTLSFYTRMRFVHTLHVEALIDTQTLKKCCALVAAHRDPADTRTVG